MANVCDFLFKKTFKPLNVGAEVYHRSHRWYMKCTAINSLFYKVTLRGFLYAYKQTFRQLLFTHRDHEGQGRKYIFCTQRSWINIKGWQCTSKQRNKLIQIQIQYWAIFMTMCVCHTLIVYICWPNSFRFQAFTFWQDFKDCKSKAYTN